MNTVPDLRHLIPINHENAWSDLFATLIDTNTGPIADVLGIQIPADCTVRRELVVKDGRGKQRIDLVIGTPTRPVAVLEAKVLALPGPEQLARCRNAIEADVFVRSGGRGHLSPRPPDQLLSPWSCSIHDRQAHRDVRSRPGMGRCRATRRTARCRGAWAGQRPAATRGHRG